MTTTTDAGHADVLRAVGDALELTVLGSRRVATEATSRGFATGYELDVTDAGNARRTLTIYVETHPDEHERDGVLTLVDETGDRVAVWLYPNDPALPVLKAAVFPDAAAVLLERMGVPAKELGLEVVSYRPGKRAVVRATTADDVLYLKVVRPDLAQGIHAAHAAWRAAGIPAPKAVAFAPEGLVAIRELPGVEALTVVRRLDEGFVEAVSALTEAIARVPSAKAARASLVSRLDWYRTRLQQLSPANATDVIVMCGLIADTYRRTLPTAVPATIHGDLHLSQLFVDPTTPHLIVGVLDIDTAGVGDRADDAGALWAHLVVTAHHHEGLRDDASADACRMLAARFRERWQRADDPGFAGRVRAVAATHVLAHALAGTVTVEQALAIAGSLLPLD
ncbi:phosphotransferase family protein [Herbiconiux sp. SYSU D00978]|uniref:phosphotransferase family protein n=1 Tax=Herbiconiux sp. SYSU D00978 TaxID=2812562 RepID=UPI001A97B81D|nr:phosphotransferase [Herbiconiux sp. SYSU D00978]